MRPPEKTLVISVAVGGEFLDAAAMGALAMQIEATPVDMVVIGAASSGLDPLVTAGWLAPRLSRAGLVVTLPALHTEPFHAARALSALDILTGGRAGWAPTALGHAEQSRRIGPTALMDEAQVGPKALDFIAAACALWDTWDADALVIDKENGLYLDPDRVRRVDYRGPYFQVMGPLNAARPLQGYPVLVQSDDDPLWRLTAAQTDVLLVTAPNADILSARRAEVARSGDVAKILAAIDFSQGGSAAKLVDQIAAWDAARLIDGVHLAAAGPAERLAFTDGLVPDLQTRGLIAQTPRNGSLRSRLGSSPSPDETFRP